jgi:hypothetical protein
METLVSSEEGSKPGVKTFTESKLVLKIQTCKVPLPQPFHMYLNQADAFLMSLKRRMQSGCPAGIIGLLFCHAFG